MKTTAAEKIGSTAAQRLHEALYALENPAKSAEERAKVAAMLLKYALRRGGFGAPVDVSECPCAKCEGKREDERGEHA